MKMNKRDYLEKSKNGFIEKLILLINIIYATVYIYVLLLFI